MMERVFKTQKIMAWVYTAAALLVFLYTLIFMTEYKDLFGLKLSQNSQISFFHDSVLQTFNRQIFALALAGIVMVAVSFFLELFSKVPDRFALFVFLLLLVFCIGGSVYAFSNIQAIESFYQGLDFQYLYLEGMDGYEPHFTTFRIGYCIYAVQILVCVAYGAVLLLSHTQFVKWLRKTAGSEDGVEKEKRSA